MATGMVTDVYMPRPMRVRPATHDDLPGILEIYNEAVVNTTASYDYEPRTLEHRIAWFEDHVKNNLPVFVAVNEPGRVVGWSALNRYHDRKAYQFTAAVGWWSPFYSDAVAPGHWFAQWSARSISRWCSGARSRR